MRRESESIRGEAVVKAEILARLNEARDDRQPVVLATKLSTGEQVVLPHPDAPPGLAAAAKLALERDEKSGGYLVRLIVSDEA